MRQQSKHQGWCLYKRDPRAGAYSCINPAAGELIQFAQISRDKATTLEIEKSLRELLLEINRTQEAKSLQLGLRLHDHLGRSLALTKSNGTASAPPLEEHIQQIRGHLGLVYPTAVMMGNPELNLRRLQARCVRLSPERAEDR